MRTPNLASISYTPGDPPTDPAQLQRWLREETTKISATFSALAAGHLDVTHTAPSKPRDIDFRVADGVHWNPGGGKGLYAFSNGVWTLVKSLP